MFSKIREVLLTQYIGAMLIALLGCQALIVFISAIMRTGEVYIRSHQHQSVFGSSETLFGWETFIIPVAQIALYLLTAYFLARWLYPINIPPTSATSDTEVEQP